MATPHPTTFKIILLTLILTLGIHTVFAWTAAPVAPTASNPDQPIHSGDTAQIKTGHVFINTTTSGPQAVGLNVNNGLRATSAVANLTRLYLDETGDAAGYWSGIELRKNGRFFLGGLFKRGDPVEANNDISIWNRSKPVLSVKQNDVVEFAGQIKIVGGTPGDGKVLTATDSLGNATWQNPTSGATGSLVGPSQTFTKWNVENHFGGGPASAPEMDAAICPSSMAMVGFNFANVGDNYSTNNPIYCRAPL